MTNPPRILERSAAWLLFLLGIWYFCLRLLGYGLEYIPGDLGDSRFVNYLLEHGYAWMTGNTDSFWTAHFMHPFPNTIALSDPMIGTQLFYMPWRAVGFSTETSYQMWWLCICALNFWVSYWVFGKLFRNKLLAAMLAWVFAFTVFNLGQLGYMHLMVRFPVPLAVYAAIRFTTQFSLKYLAVYCLCIVYQLYSVSYTGFYLLYFSLLFIFVYLLFTKRLKSIFRSYFNRQVILKTLGIFAVSAVLLALVLWPYAEMSRTVGLRLYKEVLPRVPNGYSYLLAHEASLPWHFLYTRMQAGNAAPWLHYVFPGMVMLLTLLGSVAVLIYKTIKKQAVPLLLKSLIVASAIICVLHLRVGENLTLYALIFKLPGINSMRVPNRFMQVELFFLLLILGHFVQKLNYKWLLLLLLVVLADNSFDASRVSRNTKQQLVQRRQQLRRQIEQHEGYTHKILAVVDTTIPAYHTNIDAMLVAQELGMKTINGYSGYCPDAFGEFFNHCSEKGLQQWIQNQQLKPEDILIIHRPAE
jgi:hypothetical protein